MPMENLRSLFKEHWKTRHPEHSPIILKIASDDISGFGFWPLDILVTRCSKPRLHDHKATIKETPGILGYLFNTAWRKAPSLLQLPWRCIVSPQKMGTLIKKQRTFSLYSQNENPVHLWNWHCNSPFVCLLTLIWQYKMLFTSILARMVAWGDRLNALPPPNIPKCSSVGVYSLSLLNNKSIVHWIT